MYLGGFPIPITSICYPKSRVHLGLMDIIQWSDMVMMRTMFMSCSVVTWDTWQNTFLSHEPCLHHFHCWETPALRSDFSHHLIADTFEPYHPSFESINITSDTRMTAELTNWHLNVECDWSTGTIPACLLVDTDIWTYAHMSHV